jgi:hypothetical protein
MGWSTMLSLLWSRGLNLRPIVVMYQQLNAKLQATCSKVAIVSTDFDTGGKMNHKMHGVTSFTCVNVKKSVKFWNEYDLSDVLAEQLCEPQHIFWNGTFISGTKGEYCIRNIFTNKMQVNFDKSSATPSDDSIRATQLKNKILIESFYGNTIAEYDMKGKVLNEYEYPLKSFGARVIVELQTGEILLLYGAASFCVLFPKLGIIRWTELPKAILTLVQTHDGRLIGTGVDSMREYRLTPNSFEIVQEINEEPFVYHLVEAPKNVFNYASGETFFTGNIWNSKEEEVIDLEHEIKNIIKIDVDKTIVVTTDSSYLFESGNRTLLPSGSVVKESVALGWYEVGHTVREKNRREIVIFNLLTMKTRVLPLPEHFIKFL